MLDAVGHWYGVEFRLADSAVANQPVTATFASGETRIDALALVRTVLNMTMTFDETHDGTTVVTLTPKARPERSHSPARRSTHDSLLHTTLEVGR